MLNLKIKMILFYYLNNSPKIFTFQLLILAILLKFINPYFLFKLIPIIKTPLSLYNVFINS